jgi:hypothetical protein
VRLLARALPREEIGHISPLRAAADLAPRLDELGPRLFLAQLFDNTRQEPDDFDWPGKDVLGVARYLCDLDASIQKALERAGCVEELQGEAAGLKPQWDKGRGELRVGDRVVRRVRSLAKNVICVLDVFQEEGWPHRLDDPLPGPSDQQVERLHETIRSLNEGLKEISFHSDGGGQGITWEWC